MGAACGRSEIAHGAELLSIAAQQWWELAKQADQFDGQRGQD